MVWRGDGKEERWYGRGMIWREMIWRGDDDMEWR